MQLLTKMFLVDMQPNINSYMCPSNNEQKQADAILKFLEGFLDVTKVCSDYKYPTSNFYIKEVWRIRALLMYESVDSNDTLKQLTNEMQKKFNKYCSQCNILLIIASILDPRSKLIFIKFCYQMTFDVKESKKKIDDIRACLYKFYNEYAYAIRVQPS